MIHRPRRRDLDEGVSPYPGPGAGMTATVTENDPENAALTRLAELRSRAYRAETERARSNTPGSRYMLPTASTTSREAASALVHVSV